MSINFFIGDDNVEVETSVETVDRTGVEMEALMACAVAGLTIYDMCKSSDRSMVIGELALWEKTGGKSGVWRRAPGPLDGPLVNTPNDGGGALASDAELAAIDAILEEGPLGE